MIRPQAPVASTKLFGRAVVPLLVATFACSGQIGDPTGNPMDPNPSSGGSTGSGGNKATAGTGNTTGKAGSGSSGSGSSGTSFGGAGSGGAGTEPPPGPRPVSMEGEPIYSRFVRLTNSQWENSVQSILRLSAPTGRSEGFLEPVSGTTDFDNNERVVIVDNTIWSDFQSAAEAVADEVTATDASLQNVVSGTDPATFIRTFGKRAFRRDLTAQEVTDYQALHTAGSTSPEGTQSAFTKGANWVISAMLQSPFFLYRVEMGDDGAPLDGYEMASKLSLWLRDTTPNDELLEAAAGLTSPEAAAAQATAMLDEPATAAVMDKFHHDLYKLALYDTISKDNVTGYTPELNADLKEASRLFFDRIFSANLGVRDILTSNVGFASRRMATLYGITVNGTALQEVTFSDRAGYYAQVPFLTLWAINDRPHSIYRGVRINLDTLCADPGAPAPNIPSVPSLTDEYTNREMITELTEGCAGVCHGQIINPIGFAFEDFDGMGRPRTMDNGKPVNTTGEYPFAEGFQGFANSRELMELIANGSQAHQCYAKKLTSYATARDLVERERPAVERIGAVSSGAGSSLKQVIVALVKDEAFRTHVGGAQ
ncbi:MAG TPA: DUF1592 domain-containing protein [Polyangiaceae bacterium]